MLQGTFLVFSVGRDPRQPARRLPLLLPRPAGAGDVTDRACATCCLDTWRGRLGLGVLGLFVFLAIFGSAIAPDDPNASSLDVLAQPSADHWLGTTEKGSDVFSQLLVGARVSIVVGFAAAAISAVLGRDRRAARRLLRRLDRPRARRARELVPGDPDAAADDRAGAPARPVADRADRRDRADVVGGHRPDRARPGADAARARLRRARPRAGRERRLHHPHAHPAQHAAADLRQHRADRGGGDPVRGGARVPRARRPDAHLLGDDARERVLVGRAQRRARGGT